MNLNRSLLKYSLSVPLVVIPAAVVAMAPNFAQAASDATISGVVTDSKTGEKIANALVIVQCSCLQGQREMTTNADGLYTFRNLPQGKYTVQVLVGQANVNKSMDVPPGSKYRANFSVDPANKFRMDIEVQSKVRSDTSSVTKVKMDEVQSSSSPVLGKGKAMPPVVATMPSACASQPGSRMRGGGASDGAEDPDRPRQRSVSAENSGMGDMLRFDAERLKILVERHLMHTGSARARALLADWDNARGRFVKVMPKDYRRALIEQRAEAAAKVAAEFVRMR